jgi:seryl-tRNA synthetase
LEEELSQLQKKSHKQALQIQNFEEKYKGIDITQMHKEIEMYKTQFFEAEVREKTLKNDLFAIRARMLDISDRYAEI